MNFKRLALLGISCLLSQSLLAGSMGPVAKPQKTVGLDHSDWTWVGTLTGGMAWVGKGKDQTIYLTPTLVNHYKAAVNTKTLAVGELFGGIRTMFNPVFIGELGVALGATTDADLEGRIYVNTDPEGDSYLYKYSLDHRRVALKAKLLSTGEFAEPYISGSIGSAQNYAHNYVQTPRAVPQVPEAGFTSHTQTTLSYSMGFGFQKYFGEHWQGGMGYEFTDWGKSNLGPANYQTIGTGLEMGHYYTNALLLFVNFIY